MREQLRSLVRVAGPHQDDAKLLLSELGVEPTNAKVAELPKVKNFTEALDAATERIQRFETSSLELESLEKKVADASVSAEEKKAAEQQLVDMKESLRVDLEQATQLLQMSMGLYGSKDQREQLFDARQKLAFCLLKQQQAWEAIAIGEFLAMSNPGSEQGLSAGTIALAGYGELFKTEDKAVRSQLLDQLAPFAEFMATTWPQADESAMAAAALVQFSLINKEIDRAKKYIELVPASTATGATVLREAAVQFYVQYIEAKRASTEDAPEVQAARKLAVESLEKAVAAINKETMAGPEVEAVNYLARMYLSGERADAATKLFDDMAPLKVLKDKPDTVSTRATMDTYSTALQVEIAKLSNGVGDATESTKKLSDYIGLLEESAKKDATGPQLLGGIYVQLARDLKEAVGSTKDAQKRKKLSEALVKLTSEAGKSATAFGTNYWSADTLLSIADEIKSDAAEAKKAYSEAAAILAKMISKGEAEPDWMQPKGIDMQVKLMLAKSQRGLGNFEEAIETLAAMLETSNTLTAQMEAAKTYQAWGDAADLKYHKTAIEGTRPGKNGANVIWGFSKIANVASKNPSNAEFFYEARFQVANSRFKFASAAGADKAKLLEQAAKDVQSTSRLYPALGGPVMLAKFDALLKQIQQAQGQPPVGLDRK